MTLIFVDVEAVGATPTTGLMTEFGAVEYKTRQYFHGKIYRTRPSKENAAIPEILGVHRSLPEVMEDFSEWIKEITPDYRATFVSDNPAYDFMWIACAFDKHDMANPFGHSARRIGDFYAGLKNDFFTRQDWKNLRITKHDHNPVNDAMGNVEAMHQLLQGG